MAGLLAEAWRGIKGQSDGLAYARAALLDTRRGNVYIFFIPYTSVLSMRTNIDIDDKLMAEAMVATGLPTKKATVEEALRWVIRNHRLKQGIEELRGIGWEGDLDEMRQGRDFGDLK